MGRVGLAWGGWGMVGWGLNDYSSIAGFRKKTEFLLQKEGYHRSKTTINGTFTAHIFGTLELRELPLELLRFRPRPVQGSLFR